MPIKQARRAQLRAHARAEIGHQQGESDNGKQRRPGASRHESERSVHVRKRLRRRPDQLRRIDLDRREHADHHTRQHRRQQDVAPRILRLFRSVEMPSKPM